MKKLHKNIFNDKYIYIFIIFILICIIIYLNKDKINWNLNYNNEIINNNKKCKLYKLNSNNNYPDKNNDILQNPYSEPLRDDRFFNNDNLFSNCKIPINIKTQSQHNTNYRQIGILTKTSGNDDTILPLMGKPLITHRDKWNFYTMNDKNNMIKLPIIYKNKRATVEHGVDNLYNGDIVDVLGYSDKFKVTIYDNNTMKYIPYL